MLHLESCSLETDRRVCSFLFLSPRLSYLLETALFSSEFLQDSVETKAAERNFLLRIISRLHNSVISLMCLAGHVFYHFSDMCYSDEKLVSRGNKCISVCHRWLVAQLLVQLVSIRFNKTERRTKWPTRLKLRFVILSQCISHKVTLFLLRFIFFFYS